MCGETENRFQGYSAVVLSGIAVNKNKIDIKIVTNYK
jgi:hypothetical protein